MATEHRPHPQSEAEPSSAKDDPGARRRGAGGKLRLPRRRPLREGVLAAFGRSLAVARRSSKSAGNDPVNAVHEYRKALRRARAVVSLLTPALGRRATRGVTRHLRDAFRTTSAFRDADILLQTLSSVPPVPEEDLARHTLQVGLELEQRRTRRETAETLAVGIEALSSLKGALEILLDPVFSGQDLEKGLVRSRRRERRALESARRSGDMADLHEWRKRIKELRYELELLASTGSRELKKREKALGELAKDLGEVTDLWVLAREIERRGNEGQIPPPSPMVSRIRSLATGRSSELLERGTGLFEEDPRHFARQVVAERG
jgi:CHAD domain-containing protein